MMPDLKFYLSLFLRRFHYFLIIALAVTALGVTLAYTLPPVYNAQARLLVESPQIPDELAASTVQAEAPEMLRIIQQRILTRSNLLEIARKYNIYADRPDMTADDIVLDMRTRTIIGLPNARDTTGLVTISFSAPRARLSAEVTNEFVTQMLQQSVELRTGAASQTLDFFVQEVERLNQELARQGAQILDFKLKNKDALPESLEYRRTRQASLQERLAQIDRELAGLRDRRTQLADLYERTGQSGATMDPLTPEQAQLQSLKQELAAGLVIYSPQNPRIKALQAQVAALEATVSTQLGGGTGPSEQLTAFDLQIADIDGQIKYLAEQKQLVETELASLAETIDATPGNAIALGTLERDYENSRVQYNQAVANLGQARTGDQIELTAKGQRISVIEQASEPAMPTKPNRPLIAAAGLVGGMGLGLGFVILLELLNRSIRRPTEVTRKLGITPFAAIPYIRSERQIRNRRAIIALALLAVGVGIPLGLYLLHAYVMPMDMMIDLVVDKLGLAPLLGQLR
jgi:polysaccharide chain length determinant protein (PEP-CTERM system associated)